MKVKNPDAPVTNKIFWQGINALIDLFEKNAERLEKLENKVDSGFAKLDHKIDNLAANTPTIQRMEKVEKDIKKLQVN